MFLDGLQPAYVTNWGAAYCGDSLTLLNHIPDENVNLVVTSPPFALQRQKEYGNKDQRDYLDWLTDFACLVHRKLRDDGSFVLDLGGAYEKGLPARSLYNFRVLLKLCDELGFFLAEDFYWFNPAKLPSPIEWVNKRKIRAKDAVNTVWWLSKSPFPKADVTKVLTDYSERMRKLLNDPERFYRPKKRPSGHDISKRFGKDNSGAIPSNLLQIPNTESNGSYLRGCQVVGAARHPARFPAKLPEFFIRFLTDPNDLVVDIFAGSNTTGFIAESEGRRWLAFEQRIDYVAASCFRFFPSNAEESLLNEAHQAILNQQTLDMRKPIYLQEQTAIQDAHELQRPVQTMMTLVEQQGDSAEKDGAATNVVFKARRRSKRSRATKTAR